MVVAGVVVTVVPGVVVTVVAMQHVAVSQLPIEHTTDTALEFQPPGQVKLAQVGRGVVVTVVTTGGEAVVHGDAGAGVGTGTGTGAAVVHGDAGAGVGTGAAT